jgi:hypothetical protein
MFVSTAAILGPNTGTAAITAIAIKASGKPYSAMVWPSSGMHSDVWRQAVSGWLTRLPA